MNSAKSLPPVGIKPWILEPFVIYFPAFLIELTWQVLIGGNLFSLFCGPINFWTLAKNQ